MTQLTHTLFSCSLSSSATQGGWFQTRPDAREHTLIDIALSAGTATILIEGRNTPADTAVTVATVSASGATLAVRYPQMRIHVTAASGATIRASIDRPAIPLEPFDTTPAFAVVSPATVTIASAGTSQLAVAFPTNAAGQALFVTPKIVPAWTTSNATKATVDQTGKVTNVATGTATITATSGTLTGSCAVTCS